MTRHLFTLRATVKDGERAFLMHDGRFERVLEPGRHTFFDPLRGYAVELYAVVRAEFPAERSLVGLGWIGGAHDRAPLLDRIRRFQAHDDAWAGGHEVRQAREERPLPVHRVEAFGVALAQVDHPHRANGEAVFFNAGQDPARVTGLHGIGFHYGERSLSHI